MSRRNLPAISGGVVILSAVITTVINMVVGFLPFFLSVVLLVVGGVVVWTMAGWHQQDVEESLRDAEWLGYDRGYRRGLDDFHREAKRHGWH